MYKIVVFWRTGGSEVVDEFECIEEAATMANEYRLAYGQSVASITVARDSNE